MNERIRRILKEKNLSAVRLAEILEVQPSSISHLISGRNNPNYDFITKLLRSFPEINPDWFLLGEGEMFRSQKKGEALSEKSLSLSLEPEDPKESTPLGGMETPPFQKEKQIEKIIFFYTDRTFVVYKSE